MPPRPHWRGLGTSRESDEKRSRPVAYLYSLLLAHSSFSRLTYKRVVAGKSECGPLTFLFPAAEKARYRDPEALHHWQADLRSSGLRREEA